MIKLWKEGKQHGKHPTGAPAGFYRMSNNFLHRGMDYVDFLSHAGRTLRPRTYLEVGTSEGASMSAQTCDAVCVDPGFRIERNVIGQRRRTFFFQMSSDEFFLSENLSTYFPSGIDMAFLDGMHRFEFLLRDFTNVEKHCHQRSIIFIHDCLPTNLRMAERVHRLVETEDISTRYSWTGDAWRILPIIKKYRPDLRVFLLDCPPTGLVACTNLDPLSKVFFEKYYEIVDYSMNLELSDYDPQKLASLYPFLESKTIATPDALSRLFCCF